MNQGSWVRVMGLAGMVAGVVAGGVISEMPLAGQQTGDAPKSAWAGAYSDAQADRGEREYGRTCAHCHGLALEGDGAREIPTLVSDQFVRRWRGKTVQALFDALMRSMPADDRGSMTPRMTADMIAYLLRANGAASGDLPLPSARDALAGVVIDER